jgi:hypothetical protein
LFVDIGEIIRNYNTDEELPVLFVDDDESGDEVLSMFLYDIPVAV